MKLTNLEIVQTILSEMDGEEVNSISDNAESRQVGNILKTAYMNVTSRANLPEHSKMFRLNSSGDADLPTLMYRPDEVATIEWIKYNKADVDAEDVEFEYVTILPIQQYMDIVDAYKSSESNVESLTLNGIVYYYLNDEPPRYCTILNDYNILFNAYDAEVDGTLQSSKTACFGRVVPSFEITDSYTADLDDEMFPLFINEAKSLAFLTMKQMAHEKAEQEVRRGWRKTQYSAVAKRNAFDALPNFGRK